MEASNNNFQPLDTIKMLRLRVTEYCPVYPPPEVFYTTTLAKLPVQVMSVLVDELLENLGSRLGTVFHQCMVANPLVSAYQLHDFVFTICYS